MLEKTEIQNGFRQKTTYYRWNASNQLVGITTNRGEVWYYKYDGLGRRIAKECPQRDLKIEFVWDGDQLAYTQTFKNDELQSRRHSVFNGWQLLAQQDWYSELEQHHNGNIIHQRAETSYAITQPNGKVLALLSPEGKSRWKDEPKSIWGLRLNSLFRYSKLSPFAPKMLFAGQWLDEESGLAYNRFRYYDPESACYISSDPIGLSGGETPYSYVHNTLDFLDPLGLASCRRQYMGKTPSKNSKTGREVIERMRKEGLVRNYGSKTEFKDSQGVWRRLKDADMAHKTDAVKWWNQTGRKYGARSKEVRDWMRNPDNYYLEYYSINRSQGAKLPDKYLPPLK